MPTRSLFCMLLVPAFLACWAAAADEWMLPGAAGYDPAAAEGREWHGISGGGGEFETAVVRTAGAWRRLWARLGQEPPAALDSARHMAVAVFLGMRRTGGYGVDIASVEKAGARLVIHFSELKPAAGSFVPQVLTTPYIIRILPRHAGEVVFHRE